MINQKKEIGSHLKELIRKRYKTQNEFCRKWLESEEDGDPNNIEQVKNRANKLSQLLNGTKALQFDDILILSDLLEVSCEDILSGGQRTAPKNNRLTNYLVAFKKPNGDEEAQKALEDYIAREDKPFLNADEFGKTILDYAFENKNYELLKYLTDKEYIWFVGKDKYGTYSFGAGTSIEKRQLRDRDCYLEREIYNCDLLRTDMAALAIENGDFDMLDTLHARETPGLNSAYAFSLHGFERSKYLNEKLIRCAAASGKDLLNYFSEEFELDSADEKETKLKVIFPYLGEMIDVMLSENAPESKLLLVLNNAVKYNKCLKEGLQEHINSSFRACVERYGSSPEDLKRINNMVMSSFSFNEKERTVGINRPILTQAVLSASVVYVSKRSKSEKINALIGKINGLYDEIRDMKPNI